MSRSPRLQRLIDQQGNVCALCDQPFVKGDQINIDHRQPVSRGGSDHRDNLQAAHVRCNTLRGDMPLGEWFKLRERLLAGRRKRSAEQRSRRKRAERERAEKANQPAHEGAMDRYGNPLDISGHERRRRLEAQIAKMLGRERA